jgi:hypothetical protein
MNADFYVLSASSAFISVPFLLTTEKPCRHPYESPLHDNYFLPQNKRGTAVTPQHTVVWWDWGREETAVSFQNQYHDFPGNCSKGVK